VLWTGLGDLYSGGKLKYGIAECVVEVKLFDFVFALELSIFQIVENLRGILCYFGVKTHISCVKVIFARYENDNHN